ncbi:MAG: hypothetical protein ACKOMX_06245 [Actinomycetota bacterium]
MSLRIMSGLALAALCSACRAEQPTASVGPPSSGTPIAAPRGNASADGFSATATGATYRATTSGRTGWFAVGQSADLMLSGFGFDRSGGGLMFNHPRAIASDGTRLLVSDGHNNRVLVWQQAPTANTPPDLVLGQADLDRNAPGNGLGQMNWPGQVSVAADGRVVVADTYNDRLLVWLTFPTRSGQPADYAITHATLRWPWGVWTDGTRLVASATAGRAILVWNRFPTASQPPDFTLSDPSIGTPRTIISDGRFLLVGDHNGNGDQPGNWLWRTFPVSAVRPDAFLRDPIDGNAGWLHGSVSPDGGVWTMGRGLNVWRGVPTGTTPDQVISGYQYRAGDGGGLAFAQERLYAVEYNGNKVSVYRTLPATASARPDFAVGSPSLDVNTLASWFITNPVPATDGVRLYASSDFDRMLVVWNRIPDESGALWDWRFTVPFAPWDNALRGDTLLLAGQRQVAIWRSARAGQGQLPDLNYRDRIGSVVFQELRGIAYDGRYFYLADTQAGRVYVWEGLPDASVDPVATLTVPRVTRLSSDGTWLAVTVTDQQQVLLYRVSQLRTAAAPVTVGGNGLFNLPQGAKLARGALIVGNTNNNRVHLWRSVEDAAAGRAADVVLGSQQAAGVPQATAGGFFWPGSAAYDGTHLWIGEFKFSGRLLRYSVR